MSWLGPNSHGRRQTGSTAERKLCTTCTSPDLPECMTSRRPRQRAPRSHHRRRGRYRCLATGGTWRRSPRRSVGDAVLSRTVWWTWTSRTGQCRDGPVETTKVCPLLSPDRFQTSTTSLLIHLNTPRINHGDWESWPLKMCHVFTPKSAIFSFTIPIFLGYTTWSTLTPSTPAVPNCCCSNGPAPYRSNPRFLIFDIRTLWRSVLSARAPECQKLKIVG